jgi:predicted TIM-barrel fold metal-dependent hydrolase
MIIDSHLHLPPVGEGRTLEDSKSTLLRDLKKEHVDHAILIPDSTPTSVIGSLDEVLRLAENERRLFVMGTIDIQKDKEARIRKLDSLFRSRRIVAMKIFPGHDPIYPTDKRLLPVYELCVKYRSPMVIHTGATSKRPEGAKYNDPKHIVKIARAFPDLRIVIAHYFFPRVEYCYEMTRSCSNVCFDTSGLADDEVVEETGLDRIRRVLTLTVKERPDNVVFGTDYAMCSMAKHINLIESLPIGRRLKDKVFFENSVKLFNLGLTPRRS